MLAAARLFDTVSTQERPFLRPPIIEPKAILGHDALPKVFERRVWPCALFIRLPGAIGQITKTELAREGAGDPGLAVGSELKAVVGEPRS